MELKNRKIPEGEWLKEREEVLATWHTGEGARDLQANVDYLKKLPDKKNFALKLEKADKIGDTLAQPRAGVPLLADHINLLKYLEAQGGADLLPTTIDAYTRQNRYEEGDRGIAESTAAGRALMNGFPAVNHGVESIRKITEEVDSPVEARHGTPDARLLSEIIHAGGFTSNEGGGISYNVPYAKSVSIEHSVRCWQYCDRLVGFYEENGIHLNREPFGPLTGTLVPPSTSNVVAIIEALLAAEQGVKSITVGYGQCGNITQDVAAIRALKKQCKEYLEDFDYHDCYVSTVFHQWMGGFPEDEAKAYGVISLGSAAAGLAGATKVIVKTPHEAIGIPTAEANANGIKATKMVINLLSHQRLVDSKELLGEIEIIERETKSILDKVFELGHGDLVLGVIAAFKAGVLDIPFAPSKFNQGLVMPARDKDGNIRYLDTGNLPFSKEIKDFNREKLEDRARWEDKKVDFQLTVSDIFAVGQGKLVG